MAVFAIDLALRTLQPFTNDVKAIKVGAEPGRHPGQHGASRPSAQEARERTAAVDRADDTLGAWAGDPGSANHRRLTRSRPSRPSTRSRST